MNISELQGKILKSIYINDERDEVLFTTDHGVTYKMYHIQDCCESVEITDINGDLKDLLNSPIISAEEVTNEDGDPIPERSTESWTWTFYKLATIKGYLTIRWLGSSNGYYSERVDFDYAPPQKTRDEL